MSGCPRAGRRCRVPGVGAILLAALLLADPAASHTPYGQWVVYRKAHLLVGCHRADATACALARDAAAHLAQRLPASKARTARAPAATRLASLLATDQLDVAVLTPPEIAGMTAGDGVFSAYGAIDLTTLALFPSGHALVAHARFPDEHALLVSKALDGSPLVPAASASSTPPTRFHPAVRP